MKQPRLVSAQLFWLTLVAMLTSCSPEVGQEWQTFAPAEDEPNLVIVVDPSVSSEAAQLAIGRCLFVPDSRGGEEFRPGLRSMVKIDVHGYEAYAAAFHRGTDLTQVAAVEGLCREASTLVVFRDTPLAQITPAMLPNSVD